MLSTLRQLGKWLGVLLFPALSTAQVVTPEEAYEAKYFEGKQGWQLPYRILYPKNFDATKQYPLVFMMHGSGERGNDNTLQLTHGANLFLRAGVRDSFPAIVVFPQCAERDYWVAINRVKSAAGMQLDFPFNELAQPSMQLVEGLLAELLNSGYVDKCRVYAMGLSMGGMATFELVARYPDLFAAAIPICGGSNPLLAGLYAQKVPLWVFHGDADNVVDVSNSRTMVAAIEANGGQVKYTEYPGVGHNSWDPAFAEKELLPWLFSQQRKPAGKRYVNPLFDGVSKETYTYAVKGKDTLKLDWYCPIDDTEIARPTILYIHGGGFSGGQRDDAETEAFVRDMASRGYAVASMSYRLTLKGLSFSCDQTAEKKIETFQLAVEDIRSATNYLLDREKELGIDPNKIVLIGSSAGGEALLHALFWKESQLLRTCPKLPKRFRYAGFVNMAGAVVTSAKITSDNAIPALLFHGTCDRLVPFKTASHHYCKKRNPGYLKLQGSFSIAEQYHKLDKTYALYAGCGIGHEWASIPQIIFRQQIADFIYHQVIKGEFRQERIATGLTHDCEQGSGEPVCGE
ncbi:MAG: prolyl oligopeptidase family serine peptidase [Bacteroidota bacterium]